MYLNCFVVLLSVLNIGSAARIQNSFPIDLKQFEECDFHVTSNQSSTLLEPLIYSNQHLQPWTVSSHYYKYLTNSEQKYQSNITSKEKCDLNVIIDAASKYEIRKSLDSFRGFRQTSYFIIVYQVNKKKFSLE